MDLGTRRLVNLFGLALTVFFALLGLWALLEIFQSG
jgi:hypothetical protein